MSIIIKDNFLSQDEYQTIYNLVMSHNFPWYFNNEVIYGKDTNGILDYQLTHVFYVNGKPISTAFDYLSVFFDRLPIQSIIRVKANFNPRSESIYEHGYHIDYDYEYSKSAVWYLNTNNGYTIFETGERVENIANRIVIFPSQIRHTGAACTDSAARIVFNFNYF